MDSKTTLFLLLVLNTGLFSNLNAQISDPVWKIQPKTGLYAVASAKGKVLSKYQYTSPLPFNRSIAIAQSAGKYRLVYANGTCSDSIFDALIPVQGGWFYGKKKENWEVFDAKGVMSFTLVERYKTDRDAFIRITADTGTGMIDSLGNLVAPPKYQWISKYFNGLASFGQQNRVGLLDTSGKEVLMASYDEIRTYKYVYYQIPNPKYPMPPYVNNLWVLRQDSKYGLYHKTLGITHPIGGGRHDKFIEDLTVYFEAGKCGYIDSLGRIVIPAAYDGCYLFQNGLARVFKKPNYGMINREGLVVVPFEYPTIDDFKDGYARATSKITHREHWIDAQGNIKLSAPTKYVDEDTAPSVEETAQAPKATASRKLPFDVVNDMEEGFQIVAKFDNGKYSYGAVDSLGNVVIPTQYDDLDYHGDGLFIYYRNDKRGLMNYKGEALTPPLYDYIEHKSDAGLMLVWQNRLYGCMDSLGRLKIPVKYTGIYEFKDGLAYAIFNNLRGVIDVNGREIIPFQYKLDIDPGRENDYFEFRRVSDNARVHQFVFPNGKVSEAYDQAYNFYKGVALVNRYQNGSNLWAAFNRDGAEILPLSETYPEFFSYNYLKVCDKASNCWLLDIKTGATVGKRYAQMRQKRDQPFYRVKFDRQYGMIDTFGREVIPAEMDTIFYVNDWTVALKSGKSALYDTLLNPVLPMEYEYINHYVAGCFLTQKSGIWAFTPIDTLLTQSQFSEDPGLNRINIQGKWGWADSAGKVVIPGMFDAALPFQNGKAWVFLEVFGRPFRINSKGEFILEYYP